jgi:hypothetical protein
VSELAGEKLFVFVVFEGDEGAERPALLAFAIAGLAA